jgi:NAD(P)H-hydrate epimerase
VAIAAPDLALLSVAEMGRADALTIARGTPGIDLMERAGAAVADAVLRRWRGRPVAVLSGPGNNGGDGFVAARLLREAGAAVHLGCLVPLDGLRGDAGVAAQRWGGAVTPLDPTILDGAPVVIDALFGAGLTRPLDGIARTLVEAVNARQLDCVAVDVPSGVDGDSGAVLGAAPRAAVTVTFFRRKPGHLLLPGRLACGAVEVADIGIPADVLDEIRPQCWENAPGLWRGALRWPSLGDHKYSRGHALIFGGAELTGAARLAAHAARRVGAGLVSIAAPRAAHAIYAADQPGTLTLAADDPAAADALLDDIRRNAVLVGPGNGVGEATARHALAALGRRRAVVLDADALTSFAAAPDRLFAAIGSDSVLTPHEGEFARLFPDLTQGGKLARARAAAARSRAVMLLKGADTVIAAPDGRAAINGNAPADLATAGSGDVLAGLIVGLLAQGLPAFEAAGAAAWLHGAAATAFGTGLIAEDLIDMLPRVMTQLRTESRTS